MANFDKYKLIIKTKKGERLHTWSIAHHRQLLIPVSVHSDEVLGVRVQHEPPAAKCLLI